MPISSEEVEKLAQHYFLTPTLVQQAAQLFDLYVEDDSSSANVEARISVRCLQQLLVALGSPLSQQDVVEILQLFSSSASSTIPVTVTPAAVNEAASGNGGPRRLLTSSAATAPGTRNPSKKQSSVGRHTTSAPQTSSDADASARDEGGGGATPSSTAAGGTAASVEAGEAPADGTVASAAAVNLHGMTFPAFLYFLLVYPTIVQHISKHTSSAAAANATTSAFALVDVAELFAQLDSDSDGVCSAQDIRRVAERCATDYDGLLLEDADLRRLAEMHAVELEGAIREFDVDGDGIVTLADLQQALQ